MTLKVSISQLNLSRWRPRELWPFPPDQTVIIGYYVTFWLGLTVGWYFTKAGWL